jgi:methionine synthase I (cobalamin-dependent)
MIARSLIEFSYPVRTMVSSPEISLEQAFRQGVLLMNASPTNPAWSNLPDASLNLNVTRPDLVLEWSMELLKAGADVLETRSYGAEPFTAQEHGADRSLRREWNHAAVAIARQATAGKKYTVGAVYSIATLTLLPRHKFEEHVAAFAEQVRDLWTAGVDAIHLAFQHDSQILKAALQGVGAVEHEVRCRIPTIITFDLNNDGTILSGERPEALWGMLRPHTPIALGVVTYGWGQDTVRRLRDLTDVPIGLLLDPFPYAPPTMTENRPIEWLEECISPLLSDHLLSFCGLSCTVPSIEYVKAVSRLIGQRRRL